MISTQGQASFHARIARINSGQVSCMPQPGVSDGTGTAWVSPAKVARLKGSRAPAARSHPLAMIWAFVLGALAYALSQAAGFHFLGLPDPSMTPDIRMALDGAGAMAVLAVLAVVFSAPTKLLVAVRLLGIAAAMGMMHNLVHLYPEVFEMAFSGKWVNTVRSTTEPMSILFRGESFLFSELSLPLD
ncbi:hypothetical protein [Marinovum sp.]|uniref:hypothetical protein n=1 Tax=Marinovum sp. TaxID=2024839 RepID=UPI003A93FD64